MQIVAARSLIVWREGRKFRDVTSQNLRQKLGRRRMPAVSGYNLNARMRLNALLQRNIERYYVIIHHCAEGLIAVHLAKHWSSQLNLKPQPGWLLSTCMRRANKSFRALVLSWVLLLSPLMQPVSAQDAKQSEDGAPYLGASEVAFEWQYSCSSGKACSFTCPGSGGASNVTALTLQLGTIPLSGNQRAFGIFYKFSTVQIPRANGFSLTTGISTLSCQVNGMDLDYSGPRKAVDSSVPTAGIPSRENNSRTQLR